MYLTCGPRQLFFFQCGAETPKGWTPLTGFLLNKSKKRKKEIMLHTEMHAPWQSECSAVLKLVGPEPETSTTPTMEADKTITNYQLKLKSVRKGCSKTNFKSLCKRQDNLAKKCTIKFTICISSHFN